MKIKRQLVSVNAPMLEELERARLREAGFDLAADQFHIDEPDDGPLEMVQEVCELDDRTFHTLTWHTGRGRYEFGTFEDHLMEDVCMFIRELP